MIKTTTKLYVNLPNEIIINIWQIRENEIEAHEKRIEKTTPRKFLVIDRNKFTFFEEGYFCYYNLNSLIELSNQDIKMEKTKS